MKVNNEYLAEQSLIEQRCIDYHNSIELEDEVKDDYPNELYDMEKHYEKQFENDIDKLKGE